MTSLCRRGAGEKEKERARFSSFPSSPDVLLFLLGYPAGASAAETDIKANKGTPYSPGVSFEAGRRTQRLVVWPQRFFQWESDFKHFLPHSTLAPPAQTVQIQELNLCSGNSKCYRKTLLYDHLSIVSKIHDVHVWLSIRSDGLDDCDLHTKYKKRLLRVTGPLGVSKWSSFKTGHNMRLI